MVKATKKRDRRMAAAIRLIKNGNVFSKSNLYVIGFLNPIVTSLYTLSLFFSNPFYCSLMSPRS
jgi:hypothetical protein